MRNLILSGWINVLLIAVPLSFASHFAKWGSTADFIISFIAIVPLASLLGDATEQCALKVGQTVGGLLNATFGNAVSPLAAGSAGDGDSDILLGSLSSGRAHRRCADLS